ncbi:MAG TPA: glycerophosphodiester phosphodiesterase family protein [Verrucomicrobiae bacterium]|nr:glycerophosphodiester phosphodiesterase family protein [Verrucomicrobiae bacterium]
MKIIGHRGAAGLALENSRASLLAAIEQGVDAIEFDVRLTADDRLVVIHDKETSRVASDRLIVREHTLAELRAATTLGNGEQFMSLDEALDTIGVTPVIIELKDEGSVDELLLALERHPKANISIASFHHNELRQVHKILPHTPVYVLEHYAPIAIINSARHMHATGIGLNKWLMNPLTYYLARRYHLDVYLYTVNGPLLTGLLHQLYPSVSLCTDTPERFRAH